jgi:1-acyl-sn-glycerol-3-phosphate acyltransferase
MAKQAGVPVVPIAIKHSDVLMGKGTSEARSGTLEVVILPPLNTHVVNTDDDMNEFIKQVRTLIANELEQP